MKWLSWKKCKQLANFFKIAYNSPKTQAEPPAGIEAVMRVRRRRAYLEYFHKNAAGEYVYSGAVYTYDGENRKRALTGLWACLGVAAALTILGGCVPVPGLTHVWYILIPYVLSVIAVFMALWSLGEIAAGGDPLREYVYEKSVKRLKRRTVETSICSALAFVGELVYCVQTGSLVLAAGLFLGWELVSALASSVSFLVLKTMQWKKCED